MRYSHLPLLISTILSLLPTAAVSASSQWVESGENRIRLVVADPQPGERQVNGALVIELAPGWKTYWKDPGEGGVPPDISSEGSTNASDLILAFPHPKRFDDGVTVWAGYDQPVQIPFTFDRRDVDRSGELKASVFLGICEAICVPVQAQFVVPFAVSPAPVAEQFLVQQARARLPDPAQEGKGITALKRNGDRLQIFTNMDEKPAKEVFLAAPRGWQFSAPVLDKAEGAKAEFTAKILLKPEQSDGLPVSVTYSISNGTTRLAGATHVTPN